MLIHQRVAVLAVTAAAAFVPMFCTPAAQASVPRDPRIVPAELCHPKWMVPAHTDSIFDQGQSDAPSVDDFDVENQYASGESDDGRDTVEADDLTYDGC
jgi:hypothetical protein